MHSLCNSILKHHFNPNNYVVDCAKRSQLRGACCVAHARRRPANKSSKTEGEQEAAAPAPVEPELIVSGASRRTGAARARRGSRRTQTRGSQSAPLQAISMLRKMNVVHTDASGWSEIDFGAMGRGVPQWYAISVLEGKETDYLELVRSDAGLLAAPLGAWAPVSEEAEEQQAEMEALLEEHDLVPWLPIKDMMVYSPNVDRLVPRTVKFRDGGWVLIYAVMTNELHETLTTLPYYMGWRFSFGVTGSLLADGDMLPGNAEPTDDWELPTPVPPEFWERIISWALDTSESEDLEERRLEVYGPGGGSPFGVVDRRDLEKENIDYDEAGNKIYRNRSYRGGQTNPSRWHSSDGDASTADAAPERGPRGRQGAGQRSSRGGQDSGPRSSRGGRGAEQRSSRGGQGAEQYSSRGGSSNPRGAREQRQQQWHDAPGERQQRQQWDDTPRERQQWDNAPRERQQRRQQQWDDAPRERHQATEWQMWGANSAPADYSSPDELSWAAGADSWQDDDGSWDNNSRGRGGRGGFTSNGSRQDRSAGQRQGRRGAAEPGFEDAWDLGFGDGALDQPPQQQQQQEEQVAWRTIDARPTGGRRAGQQQQQQQQGWVDEMEAGGYGVGASKSQGNAALGSDDDTWGWLANFGQQPGSREQQQTQAPPPQQQKAAPAAAEAPADMMGSWEGGEDQPLVQSTRRRRQ